MRKAFEEELQKTRSGQSWKIPASWHHRIPVTPTHSPYPFCKEGCTLPAVSPCWAPFAAGKAGVRITGTSPPGGVTNPWQSPNPNAALKSATGIWQLWRESPQCSCAFTMLCRGGRGRWGALMCWEHTVWQVDPGQTQMHYPWSKHC